jgi:signal transduction histidine kinase
VPIAGGGMQVIATPCQEEMSVLHATRRALGALTLAGGLVALPVGYALAGLALRPLDEAVRERSEFVALASHQLRTPLAVIKTSAELARAGRGLSPDEALDTIAQQAKRIEALAARLTALGRAETDARPQGTPVNLADVARDVVSGLTAAARQKAVMLNLDVKPAWVRVDRDAAADMITAIVENAIQFSPPGGAVSAGVHVRAGHAVVEIADQGPGIPEDELSLVTDPFYQGRRARGGYGLGLAIARSVAERHSGQLTIESVVDRGTTVRVSLPIRPAPRDSSPA